MANERESTTEKECPNCHGEMMAVMSEWICQKPCGFRSSDPSPVAWAMLHTLRTMVNVTQELATRYEGVLPTSNIIRDLNQYRRRKAIDYER